MLLLTILSYYRLFHLKLFFSIVDYFTLHYFWQFKVNLIYDYWWLLYKWLLVDILLVIINGYYRLNYHKILMAIGGYFINGY